MARTITEIQGQIKDTYAANMAAVGVLVDPTTWSATSIEKLLCDAVAFCIWLLESLFDTFKTDVNNTIKELKPHSTLWYANKSKAFQYGHNLVSESDYYDNTGLTDSQIAASKIIAHCAVVEQEISPNRDGLRIKVATTSGNDLGEVPSTQLDAFKDYMKRVKDGGVSLLITSGPPDSLILKLRIYYNPLVLNSEGKRLDGTDPEPVQTAIKNYLKALPFNGIFVLAYLTDQLQQVDGVVIPHVLEASAQYGALQYSGFTVDYLPDSGYLRINNIINDLQIEWVPRSGS